ncbi:MAG: dephospho-CoA kinase [Acidobacteria bacterium]|nr:dephospho-CoA kinase [Acidobacteriota bacterium]
MSEFGLTGGIGSGKSTVGELLSAHGAAIIDANAIVRVLQAPGEPVFEEMVKQWGDRIVMADGTLDRAAVAEIAFGDEDELERLNDIVHPAVGEEMARRRKEAVSDGVPIVLDIPLLVRPGDKELAEHYQGLAGIIVVDVDPDVALARLIEHRGFSQEDAMARMVNQATRQERLNHTDFTIDNNGDLEALRGQVERCWAWMQEIITA